MNNNQSPLPEIDLDLQLLSKIISTQQKLENRMNEMDKIVNEYYQEFLDSDANYLDQINKVKNKVQALEAEVANLRTTIQCLTRIPNAETIQAMEDARNGKVSSFDNVEDLMKDLNNDDEQAASAPEEVSRTDIKADALKSLLMDKYNESFHKFSEAYNKLVFDNSGLIPNPASAPATISDIDFGAANELMKDLSGNHKRYDPNQSYEQYFSASAPQNKPEGFRIKMYGEIGGKGLKTEVEPYFPTSVPEQKPTWSVMTKEEWAKTPVTLLPIDATPPEPAEDLTEVIKLLQYLIVRYISESENYIAVPDPEYDDCGENYSVKSIQCAIRILKEYNEVK